MHASIAFLNSIRKAGLEELLSEILSDHTMTNNISKAIHYPDVEVRVDLLGMLCDSQKGNQELSKLEFSLLRKFIVANNAVQSPEYRQKVQGCYKKLFTRIRRTVFVNWRDVSNRNVLLSKKVFEKEKIKEIEKEISEIMQWMEFKINWIRGINEFVTLALFPGASYQRTTSTLTLMSILMDSELLRTEKNTNVDYTSIPFKFNLSNPETVNSLVTCICHDPYDANRMIAFGILLRIDGLPGVDVVAAGKLLEKGVKMFILIGTKIRRIRAADGEAGAMLIRLIFKKFMSEQNVKFKLHDLNVESKEISAEALLEKNVSVGVEQAMLAAYDFPTHGIFITLKYQNLFSHFYTKSYQLYSYIFSDLDNKSTKLVDEQEEWRFMVDKLISISEKACENGIEILSDDSPEGNVPEHFDSDFEAFDVLSEKGPKQQILLNQSFRTVKAATSFISTLICCSTIVTNGKDALNSAVSLKLDQIERCGLWLRKMLTSIRHRGAFSSVSETFARFCERLLKSDIDELIQFPLLWLRNFLEDISNKDVSVTRRSAGA
ncbi:hypothetical protein HK096_005648, partial [Nowakowskiella sp. JEL0078]